MIEQNLCVSEPLDVDTHWAPSCPCRGHGRSDIVLLQQHSVPAGGQARGHLPDPSPDLRAPCPHLPGLCREALLEQGWGCSPPGAEARVEDWAISTGDSLSQIWAWVSFPALFRACQSLCLFYRCRKSLVSELKVKESKSEVAQSCLTLCDPMDSSLPQAPLSMGFSRQEYWSGLPLPSLGDLLNPGIEPRSLTL